MTDNVSSPLANGTVIAADQIGSVYYPRTKICYGDDGTAIDVAADNPLPISVTNFPGTQLVSVSGAVSVTGTFFPATQPVSIASTITVNHSTIGGVAVAVGAGASGTGTQRVVLSSDSAVTVGGAIRLQDSSGAALGTSSNPLYVSGGTGGGSGSGVATGPAGTPSTSVVTVQGITGGVPVTITNAGDNTANFATSQVTVSATVGSIVAARTGRRSVIVQNMSTVPIYLSGSNSVTSNSGFLLPGQVGASVTLSFAGALYGITASGSGAVSVAELY